MAIATTKYWQEQFARVAWTVFTIVWILVAIVWTLGCLVFIAVALPVRLLLAFVADPIAIAILLRGDVETAWKRCLPRWIRQGSISDRRGRRSSSYVPSFDTCLGRAFTDKFAGDYEFLAKQVASSNEEVANCAIEMLVLVCARLESLPSLLLRDMTPIPRRELPPSRSEMRLGEFLQYQRPDKFDEWYSLWYPHRTQPGRLED